jgi:hypothetical protein
MHGLERHRRIDLPQHRADHVAAQSSENTPLSGGFGSLWASYLPFALRCEAAISELIPKKGLK